MRIQQVRIKHFRSIKDVTFYPKEICALVGENNAGKTNILTALHFLLGETWPSKRSLEKSDYFQEDTSQPIFIEASFSDNQYGISSIRCNIPWEGRAETRVVYRDGHSEYLSNAVRDLCALVYLDSNRNLEYHLGHARWTIFGRITRKLDEDFRNSVPERQRELEAQFNRSLELLRTELFQEFEQTFRDNFDAQLKRTNYAVSMEFRTFDPLNYYRALFPLLTEDGKERDPAQAGQGMRNLILLALFRTYAKILRDDALIAIEEPEIFLHPHSQRSLHFLFKELARTGSQIFYSTHSGNFVDIEHFDHICLVEKRVDDEGDVSTQVRQVFVEQLLNERRRLYPGVDMSEESLRERYYNLCTLEHNEAFFARKVILVEGQTEEYALPVYAKALGYDLDTRGVSIVNAHSKNSLDQLYQLYAAFGIPVYLIFDNDLGGNESDLRMNEKLLQMLGREPQSAPPGEITEEYAILERDFEDEMKRAIGSERYSELKSQALHLLGRNVGKGLIARYMARTLVAQGIIPLFVEQIIRAVQRLDETEDDEVETNEEGFDFSNEDEIPF